MNLSQLRTVRAENQMTQAELARKIGVSKSAVAMWESGRREPDLRTLRELCNLFNIGIDELVARIPRKETPLRIPVLGCVQAGIPIEAIEDVMDYEEIPADMARKGEYFALKIRGKSMEPRFREGDVVIVRRTPDVESGEIAIVLVNGGEATVKKVVKQNGGITLVPLNPAFDPLFYSTEEIEMLPVRVLGKVVELRAKF